MTNENVVTTVRGTPITVADVVQHLKVTGFFRKAIYDVIERHVVRHEYAGLSRQVPDDQVEKKVRERQYLLGIRSEDQLERHLSFHGVSRKQFETYLQEQVIRDVLKQEIVSDEDVREAFTRMPEAYRTVKLSRIMCTERDAALEVLRRAENEQEDFGALARLHSVDHNTRFSGGFIGNVRSGMLTPEVEREIFATKESAVVGPFAEGSLWTVYKVWDAGDLELTDKMMNHVRDRLFDSWLRERVVSAPA